MVINLILYFQLMNLLITLNSLKTADEREQNIVSKMKDVLHLHDRLRKEAEEAEERAMRYKREVQAKVKLEVALKKFSEFFKSHKDDLNGIKHEAEQK